MSSPADSPADRRFVQIADALREPNAWTNNEWLCRPDLVAAEKLLLVRANMDPMHCHPFHYHPHREEIIYVIYGRAEQWVGNEYRILSAGEMAHIPAGTIHSSGRNQLVLQGAHVGCRNAVVVAQDDVECKRLRRWQHQQTEHGQCLDGATRARLTLERSVTHIEPDRSGWPVHGLVVGCRSERSAPILGVRWPQGIVFPD